MLAASAQPQPPHLLVTPQHPLLSPPVPLDHHERPALRKPMAPVPEVEDTLSPAPPGRLKTLFSRRSHGTVAAAAASSSPSSSPSPSPAPSSHPPALAITPPPPPPATALSSLDPSPPLVSSTPDPLPPPPPLQQQPTNSTRARLKSLFTDSTRPASQAVRALGNGFPGSSSLRASKQQSAPLRTLSMQHSKSTDMLSTPTSSLSPYPHSPSSPTLPSNILLGTSLSPHSQSLSHIPTLPQLNLPPPPSTPPPTSPSTATPTLTCRTEQLSPSPAPSLGPSRRSSPRVSVVTPPNPRDSSSTLHGGSAHNGNSLRRNLGRSLLKGSLSSPSLTGKEKKEPVQPVRKAKDDTDTRKKGRHSLAVLFQGRNRAIVAREPKAQRDSPHSRMSPVPQNEPPQTRGSPLSFNARSPAEASPSSSVHTPRAVSRTSSLSALRTVSHQPSKSALKPSGLKSVEPSPRIVATDVPYTGPSHNIYGNRAQSASSLSPVSPLGMSLSSSSIQRSRTSITGSGTSLHASSHTSLSLSQTSLVLPEASSRSQLLPKDHYHLRFASSYIINLITPTLRTVHFSRSERNRDLKRITEERLSLLARMERTWGTSWADAASDLLNGSASTSSLELKEAKLRACNITATAKARERKVFVSAMRDGILFCFLFNRLFPSQPASIQRVKVPKDDVRVAANITRFLTACREIGVGEGDMFCLEDLDDQSPVGLARVARTILILANMAPPVAAPRPSASRGNLRTAASGTSSPAVEAGPSAAQGSASAPASAPGSTSARSSKASSRPESPRTYSATAIASRTLLERPLRSSSSDLHARLQQESSSSAASTVGTASSSSMSRPAAAAATAPPTAASAAVAVAAAASASVSASTTTDSKPAQPSRLSSTYSATPPMSPVRSVGMPATPRTSGSQTHNTPPTARPQRIATSKTQVSFKSDSSSPHASGNDWCSSFSSNHSATHLSPLHERERTPSLVSNSSQVASSYSRSSIRGSVPTILNEDPHLEDEFDHIESGHIESGTTTTSSLNEGRRLSEKTLQDARRKIIGTLLSSTDDLHRPSLEEARGFALSQSLAALEGSRPPLGKSRSETARIRPIARAARSQSAENTQTVSSPKEGTDPSPRLLNSEQLPPRPRIRRPSVNGKIYVPKRTSSPASSPNLSMGNGPTILSPAPDPAPYLQGHGLTKEDRRRSEDFPSRGVANNGNRIMNMRNHSMINLPATSRRTSSLSHGSVDSTVTPSLQILRFNTPGQPAIRYQLGNCIGRGQFGSVYRSLNLSTGQMVAIKRIRLSGMKETEVGDVMREVELLQRLSHPGIVKYEGMSRDDAFLNIVLEFVENGSLGQTLKAFGRFNERLVASYVAKILEGLNYLHSEGVVHCDLKAANILSTKNGNIKLSDFGVSLNMRAVEHFAERTSIGRGSEPMKTANDVAGTPNWMAPEVIKLQGASPKSDIWSLGCTIVELLTGKPPYSDVRNSMTVLFRIVEDPLPPLPEASPELKDFLTLCFAKNPDDRPTAALLFEHEWVKAGHPDLIQRPQDSLPFLRRLSQEPNRMDSQRIFQVGGARSASASLVDLHATPPDHEAAETRRHAQLSMVSLHSHLHQSREGLESTAAKAHDLVKTTFAKSITCHVCLEGVKKAAYLCQNCGLITHAKCAPRAKAGCDVRGQLALLVSQQEWGVSEVSSRANSPQPESPVFSLSSRLFGRNKSKSSLLAAPSTTSLVTPDVGSAGRRRHSSGAASSSSRPFLDAVSPSQDGAGSFHSRHSETSEDGAGSVPRDRNTSLIRIDEDGPVHPSRANRHVSGPPAVKVHDTADGNGPRRNGSVTLRNLRKDKRDKEDKNKDKANKLDEENLRTDCIIQ